MPDLANGTNGTNGVTSTTPSKPAKQQHIWVVTGPAGCGKSTVGNVLRKELGIPFLEGDDVSTQVPECTTPYTPHTHKPPNCTQTQQSPKYTQITNTTLSTTPQPTKKKWAKASHSQTKTAGTG